MINWERDLNALLIFILSAVLLSSYGVQFVLKEDPCPYCMMQRAGMIAVASAALLNIVFGINIRHYAIMIISALLGGSIALRQIAMHNCPDLSKEGVMFFGLSLFTWSFIIFVCVLAMVSLLLALYNTEKEYSASEPINMFGKVSIYLLVLSSFANIFTAFSHCGLWLCLD